MEAEERGEGKTQMKWKFSTVIMKCTQRITVSSKSPRLYFITFHQALSALTGPRSERGPCREDFRCKTIKEMSSHSSDYFFKMVISVLMAIILLLEWLYSMRTILSTGMAQSV